MPEQVIQAIMARRNPRTGSNYTRDEAEAIYSRRAGHALKKLGAPKRAPSRLCKKCGSHQAAPGSDYCYMCQ